MIYLASAYSDPDPAIRERRYRAALKETARLVDMGVQVFCPVVYTHELAKACKKAVDDPWWYEFMADVMLRCDTFQEFVLWGCPESVGVRAERRLAERMGKRMTMSFETKE